MAKKNSQLSLVDVTANKIIEYIKKNNLKPDDKLPTEQESIKFLKVSRSTLREAIKLLVSRNILTTVQGSGVFISRKRGIPTDPLGLMFMMNDPSLFLDLINTRLILEPPTAALACQNATDAQLIEIKKACLAVEEKIQANQPYLDEDIQLHFLIAAASGNQIIKNLVPIIHTSVYQFVTCDSLRDRTVVIHRKLVDRILHRDSEGAKYAMICHLAMNRDYVIEKTAEKEQKKDPTSD